MADTVGLPLPLSGAKNVRDLGGYPIPGGKTKSRRFLRSDGLHHMTASDIRTLRNYGVTRIIDLRTEMESGKSPDPVIEGVVYGSYPLIDGVQSQNLMGDLPASLLEMYKSLLDKSQPMLAAVLRDMARHQNETILFHCTAGKDRTGVLAMLLLQLAGVSAENIIADYACTEIYMKEIFDKQKEQLRRMLGTEVPGNLLESPAHVMKETLDYLCDVYGGAEAYMAEIGLTAGENGEIRLLKESLQDIL